jgi:hypothetical protein
MRYPQTFSDGRTMTWCDITRHGATIGKSSRRKIGAANVIFHHGHVIVNSFQKVL